MKFPRMDFQVVALFLLSVAFLINSMALFQREHKGVVIHNPATNIAKMVHATRDERAMRDLMLGGFREGNCYGFPPLRGGWQQLPGGRQRHGTDFCAGGSELCAVDAQEDVG